MQEACSEKRFKLSSRVSEGSLKTFPDPPMRLALTSPKTKPEGGRQKQDEIRSSLKTERQANPKP